MTRSPEQQNKLGDSSGTEVPTPTGDTGPVATQCVEHRLSRSRSRVTLGMLLVVPASLILLFLSRPNFAAVLTVIPAECWFMMGILTLAVLSSRYKSWSWITAFLLWGIFALFFIEPLSSIPRSFRQVRQLADKTHSLRVVLLNCDTGSMQMLSDLKSQAPDLILLQESPGRETLEQWCLAIFGGEGTVIWGRDCSILGRGSLIAEEAPEDAAFVSARWEPAQGRTYRVVSLRLWPQPFRMDLWNPECWHAFSEVRHRQIQQARTLCSALERERLPIIIGGDFNSPPGDPCETPLAQLGLKDPFHVAGRGWGKTIINSIPFHRIDRFWLSRTLTPNDVRAVKSSASDHRLVRLDLAEQ